MTLDRDIKCAYCRKPIPYGEDFFGSSFGTSSNAKLPMVSIAGVHWNCTFKILNSWVKHRIMTDRVTASK